jgi:hypothetical protein
MRAISGKTHSPTEIHNRRETINRRLAEDCVLTDARSFERKALAVKTVQHTWHKCLLDDSEVNLVQKIGSFSSHELSDLVLSFGHSSRPREHRASPCMPALLISVMRSHPPTTMVCGSKFTPSEQQGLSSTGYACCIRKWRMWSALEGPTLISSSP